MIHGTGKAIVCLGLPWYGVTLCDVIMLFEGCVLCCVEERGRKIAKGMGLFWNLAIPF
jgi:hypothetical protein